MAAAITSGGAEEFSEFSHSDDEDWTEQLPPEERTKLVRRRSGQSRHMRSRRLNRRERNPTTRDAVDKAQR